MTTIVCIRKNDSVVLAGDGQVTLGNTIMKTGARKIRKMGDGHAIAGFAGSTADAFALFEKFDEKLSQYNGRLVRAAVELAKEWRTSKALRNLDALLAAADQQSSLIVSGNGDVIESDDGIIAIGSGGPYALSAARALMEFDLTAREIAERSLSIAAEICLYTNSSLHFEELPNNAD